MYTDAASRLKRRIRLSRVYESRLTSTYQVSNPVPVPDYTWDLARATAVLVCQSATTQKSSGSTGATMHD